jgi:hypothetical protein
MATTNTISYGSRDFATLRQEQIDYINKYYPDVIQNFNDGSIMSVFLDLGAALADNLHFNIDRSLQETVLDFAQETSSLFNIAKTYGLKLPTLSASIAVCQFSVQVPVFGDAEDTRYLPVLKAGTQVQGNGQTFELLYDVDFSSNLNSSGALDRTKIPVFNNGILTAYLITKTGIVVAGTTRIYTQVFNNTPPTPFYQITLPENNVLDIESVIHKNGINFTTNPTDNEFASPTNKWYEVNSLAENSVFVYDTTVPPTSDGIYKGIWLDTNYRFVREFTPTGFCTLTFGGQTNQAFDILDSFLSGNSISLSNLLNNNSLGYAPLTNTTMYVKYRVGGGSSSNVGANVITSFGYLNITLNGPDAQLNGIVQGSLTVTNITPAVGGGEAPSIEELRNYISYNFAAQNRAVTLNDYKAILLGMPSNFGTPARVGVRQNQNKIEVNPITVDSSGAFDSQITSVILENIATYLSEYRMINDYVVVKPGEVVDLSFEISVVVDSTSQLSTVTQIISAVTNEFVSTNRQMGQSYYVYNLNKIISQIQGVLNLNYIKVFNITTSGYSQNTINQNILDTSTGEIDITTGILNCDENQILQLRNPNSDIVVIPVVSTPIRTLI